jgi:EAL domain-containing protein (putative c-di-GMP-specific phosphodiesterase class I)
MDVDLIKFDMDLVRNLDGKNNANREILQAITGICRKRGIHTLAEGVETEEQKEFLIRIGCELSQGYFYHRPEPLEQILYKRQYGHRQREMISDERRKQLI